MFTRKPDLRLTPFLDGTVSNVPHEDMVLFRTRIFAAIDHLVRKHQTGPFELRIGMDGGHADAARSASNNQSKPKPPKITFTGVEPHYRFDQLVLPVPTIERIMDCVAIVEVAPRVFGDWGLRVIEPHPSIAVNFRGPPGTGKTMAAHAMAHRLGRKILLSRLSELESKYHGDGPKNLVELFNSAKEQEAVLFIDEAESLLSRRFAHPEQAAESAINSMRTELLMALDSFDGLVIFASNLPDSYDAAVESRLLHVEFVLPDAPSRRAIWQAHLPPTLPVATDVTVDRLAETEGISGRDIKMAVVSAAVGAARRGLPKVPLSLLIAATNEQLARRKPTGSPTPDPQIREKILRAAERDGLSADTT